MRRTTILLPVVLTIITILAILLSCNEGVKKDKAAVDTTELTQSKTETHGPIITEDQVKMTHPLNKEWVADGKKIYELKCQACHKLSEEKLVGPGWTGVTKRRTPVWILNMITDTDYMLDKDPAAAKLLELCMVRMPNQNLSFNEARQVLEFQRSNDGDQ